MLGNHPIYNKSRSFHIPLGCHIKKPGLITAFLYHISLYGKAYNGTIYIYQNGYMLGSPLTGTLVNTPDITFTSMRSELC